MGSVLDDYKCPRCDHHGNGGYAWDAIGYPICNEGAATCLSKAIHFEMSTRAEVKKAALMVIIDRPVDKDTKVHDVLVVIGGIPDLIADFL